MSLATKHRPSQFSDVVEQETIINIVSKLCEQEDIENRNFLFIGPAGCGKAQPLYSKVLTPNGYVQMKDVEEGTVVLAGDGYSFATVDKVFPQGVRDIYQIILSDGSKFEVADNHLNSVFFVDDFGNEVDTIVDTLTLIEMLKHHEWIGIRNVRVDGMLNPRDFMKDFPKYSHLYENLVKMLKDGTLPENFYLIGSQNLLTFFSQILLGNTSCEFESSQYVVDFRNREASIAFTNLVRALGYVDIVSFVDRLDNPESNGYYRHEVYFDTFRIIENIEFFERSECKCIYIDHPEHTYLTDNFTLTHNTTTARIMANVLNHGQGTPIEIDAASHNGVESVRELVSQARMYPVGSKYKVFIIDECFHSSTMITTPEGLRTISSINVGDRVKNLTGEATVLNVFKNKVRKSNLVLLSVSGQKILTTRNHLFFTDDGWVAAENLKQGDFLYDYKTLCDLRKDVPVFRERPSSSLRPGMWRDSKEAKFEEASRIDTENWLQQKVSDLWERFLYSEKCKFSNLFIRVRNRIQEATRTYSKAEGLLCEFQAGVYLSDLWEAYDDPKIRLEENLQCCLRNYLSVTGTAEEEKTSAEILFSMWKSIHFELSGEENLFRFLQVHSDRIEAERENFRRNFFENENQQSYVESRKYKEDDRYQIAEWYFAYSTCNSWRKRTLYNSSDSFERVPWSELGTRVSCMYKGGESESGSLSYELQTRPRLSGVVAGSRGGWCRAQYEINQIVRFKESGLSRKSRVDSVEIYKSGDNDGLFSCYFSDSELDSETVQLYDLEIDGHPSFYANGLLVHNCHAFSPQAWQIWLKPLEDAPAKSIYIFCTTNPEKIPATIISRVQTFQLSKISLKGIFDRLCYIIEQENKEGAGITYTDDAVNYISKLASGGMRDAITNLDKVLAFTHDLTSESVAKALNLPEYDDYFKLLAAYSKKDNKTVSEVINNVYNSGVNFVKWFEGFHSFVMNVVKYIFLQDINLTMIPSHYQSKISKYGTAHSVVCLKLANKLLKLNYELKTTQYLQEVALTYLCQLPKKGE